MLDIARGRCLLDASIIIDASIIALDAKVLARVPFAKVLAKTKVPIKILAIVILDAKVAARILAIRYRISTKVF